VNFVWNFCVNAQKHAKRWGLRWPTPFDLMKLCSGATKELGLHSDTLQDIPKQFAKSRDQHKKRPRYRSSKGKRRALGWVPFMSGRAIKVGTSTVTYLGKKYSIWKHREMPSGATVKCGSFSEDARGRWYVNLCVDVPECKGAGVEEIGIDLGLRELATLSNGENIPNPRHYRALEDKLGKAQRAGRSARANAIHAKIKNRRRHDLHVASRHLVNRCKSIFVGNVNASKLAKTKMAKSVLDAGWSEFRNMLDYKSRWASVVFREVNEANSTRVCSRCKTASGPKGIADLGVREWTCVACGAVHDRDVNAAQNILLLGQNAVLLQTESPGL